MRHALFSCFQPFYDSMKFPHEFSICMPTGARSQPHPRVKYVSTCACLYVVLAIAVQTVVLTFDFQKSLNSLYIACNFVTLLFTPCQIKLELQFGPSKCGLIQSVVSYLVSIFKGEIHEVHPLQLYVF